jgi:DNA-binding LacI/PurR family transcriptional regulator
MSDRRVGIKEVASELGMAISTVSRAMNARGEVSVETRDLVRATADRLGYRPNQSGRSLRYGATDTVALVMPTNTTRTQWGDTFYLTVCTGLQEVLAARGLNLVILPFSDAAGGERYLRNAVDRHLADAFILASTQRVDPRIDFLLERRVPFVTLGRTVGADHAWLDLDFEAVAAASVRRMAAAGHSRIAIATTDEAINSTHEFGRAYRSAMAEVGLDATPELEFHVPSTRDGGTVLAERLIASTAQPTAVILAQETLALGLYPGYAQAGRMIGPDLAVIGFRKNPVCEFLTPSLTCFSVELEDYGRRLAQMVLAQLDGDGTADPLHDVWPMTLVPGMSDSAAMRRAN